MLNYLLRRFFYAIPILLGVNIITFILFFVVNTPDDMARIHLGNKRITPEQITQWKIQHGYNKPLLFNKEHTDYKAITDTLFITETIKLFSFNFGSSDYGRDIIYDIKQRMWPSLALAVPTLICSLVINICIALTMTFFRGSHLDYIGVIICIILMSVSSLFYIIGGQYIFAILFKWFPISGYHDGIYAVKFVALPVFIAVIASIGMDSRWYRMLFLEEIHKEYVTTARAKGLSDIQILFKHVLKNALIPIITGIIILLPYLFLGSLLLESFFGIPGLGNYTIDAITQQDFAIVKTMVFIGSVLYIFGLIMTDIAYSIVDPRIKLS